MKVYHYFNNIVTQNISQEFRLKNIDETRNYFFEELHRIELMSKILIYIENFRSLAYINTGYILISAFSCLICISIGITSSEIRLKICATTAGVKKYKSIMKKKKKKHDKKVFLAKSNLAKSK